MPETTVTLSIEGMTCPSCSYMIESELGDLVGVSEAKVSLEAKNCVVKYDDSSASGPNDFLKLVNELSDKKFKAKLVKLKFFFLVEIIYKSNFFH